MERKETKRVAFLDIICCLWCAAVAVLAYAFDWNLVGMLAAGMSGFNLASAVYSDALSVND